MTLRDLPIFVNCRDRVSSLRLLIGWLERAGHERIILVDNASTYPPLLDYYEITPHEVLRLDENIGQSAVWDAGVLERCGITGHFVLTDPDVVPSEECPPDAVAHLLAVLDRHPERLKVGLGLRIDDLPDSSPQRDAVIEWERVFWEREVEPGVFDAPVDTTFAVYVPDAPYRQDLGLRTGPPYVARHLPWYADPAVPTAEERYYLEHAREGVLTWGGDALAWSVVEGLDVRRNAGSERPPGTSAFAVGDAPGNREPVRHVSVLVERGADADAIPDREGADRGVTVELVPVDPDARNRAHALNLAADRAHGDALTILRRGERFLPGALAAAADRLRDAMWVRAPVEVVDTGAGVTRVEAAAEWSLDRLFRQDPVEQPWLCWRRDALEGAGGFDESVPLLCEYDFEIRLAQGHEPAVLPAPAVHRTVDALHHWPPRRVAEDRQLARIRAWNHAIDVAAWEEQLATTRAALEEQLATARVVTEAETERADDLGRQLHDIRSSTSWRITRPLRDVVGWLRARGSRQP